MRFFLAWTILLFMVFAFLAKAHGGPVEDRWPIPGTFTTPSAYEAASFINAWDLATDGVVGAGLLPAMIIGGFAGGVVGSLGALPPRRHHARRH